MDKVQKFQLYVLNNYSGILYHKVFQAMVKSMEKLNWDENRYDDVIDFWLDNSHKRMTSNIRKKTIEKQLNFCDMEKN